MQCIQPLGGQFALAGTRTWYTKAAETGNTDAQFRLGVLLADRLDPPDLAEARSWYTKAAETGNTGAQDALDQGAVTDRRTQAELGGEALSAVLAALWSGTAKAAVPASVLASQP